MLHTYSSPSKSVCLFGFFFFFYNWQHLKQSFCSTSSQGSKFCVKSFYPLCLPPNHKLSKYLFYWRKLNFLYFYWPFTISISCFFVSQSFFCFIFIIFPQSAIGVEHFLKRWPFCKYFFKGRRGSWKRVILDKDAGTNIDRSRAWQEVASEYSKVMYFYLFTVT